MFDPTPQELYEEVRAAQAETKVHAQTAIDLYRRINTRWYRMQEQTVEAEPENFGFAFMSNILPQLAAGDPEAAVEAARVVGHRTIAQAMEDGIDALVRDLRYAERVEPVFVDYLVLRGIMLHYIDEDARFSRGSVTPTARRVDPLHFFIDSLADDLEQDEFRGHEYFKDYDDLANDPNINTQALESLHITSQGGDEIGDDLDAPRPRYNRTNSATALNRQRVRCYSVWLRRSNQIRVLAKGSTAVELYNPVEYFGPTSGPYVLFDAYPVPGAVWPLSPLVATKEQAHDLNENARAMTRAAARRKTMVLVEAQSSDLGQKIANAEDGSVLPVKGITGNHVQIEVGGNTTEQYQYTEYVRQRLDRISGLTATVQGAVGGADTATEAQIANDALTNRIGFLRRHAAKAVERSLWTLGWYLFHTEGIIIPVNRRDAYTGELMEGLFFGGPSPTDMGAQWDDFTITVKLNTLQHQMRARENTLGFYQVFAQVLPMIPAIPYVRWMSLLRDVADAFELSGKVDEWLIPEMLGAFGAAPMSPVSGLLGSQPPQQGQQNPMDTDHRGGVLRPTGQMMLPQTPAGQPFPAIPGMPGQGQAPGSPGGPGATATGQTTGPRPRRGQGFAA